MVVMFQTLNLTNDLILLKSSFYSQNKTGNLFEKLTYFYLETEIIDTRSKRRATDEDSKKIVISKIASMKSKQRLIILNIISS